MSRILALDLGQKLGWCTGKGVCGTFNMTRFRKEGRGKMISEFRLFLDRTIKARGPFDLVVYEQIPFASTTLASQSHGAFLGMLQYWCQEKGLRLEGINVKKNKAKATHGAAEKWEMILTAELLGYCPDTDNAADAAHLWEYANERLL